jgi:predicted AAA+ superfamily ATPase
MADYPGVLLVGARQSGKTTLAKTLGSTYFDLEQESDRLRLDLAWDSVCEGREAVVLDEAQAWPEVFPRLRGAIDADRSRVGRFLLLGSVAPSLMRQVSDSLAGRLAILHLPPLTLLESPEASLDMMWLRGCFPGPFGHPRRYPRWHQDYLSLLAQRDLPEWGLAAKPKVTERLFKMLGAVHGQSLNLSQLGKSLGVSHTALRSYLDFLTGAFLVRELPVYAVNVKKRLVKSPKIYWVDSGLLHALMGVEHHEDLLSRPWVGASWEGFVIQQIIDSMAPVNPSFDPAFLRTSDGYELDLVFRHAGKLWAVEIKLTTNPSADEMRRLNKTADLIGADQRVLLSRVAQPLENAHSLSCNLPHLLKRLHG